MSDETTERLKRLEELGEELEDSKTKTRKSVFFALALLPSMIWSGFAILKLWAWFMVPLGLPVITLAHAIGIDLLVTFISVGYVKTDIPLTESAMRLIFKPAFYLLFGYIASLFM